MAGRSQNGARGRSGQDPGGLLRHDKLEGSLRHESGDLGIKKWGAGWCVEQSIAGGAGQRHLQAG